MESQGTLSLTTIPSPPRRGCEAFTTFWLGFGLIIPFSTHKKEHEGKVSRVAVLALMARILLRSLFWISAVDGGAPEAALSGATGWRRSRNPVTQGHRL